MLFHLFCMFHNYGRIKYRSQHSAGKRTSNYHIYEDQLYPETIGEFLFHPKTEEARRRAGGVPQGGHTWSRRGPTPGRAWTWCGSPGSHLAAPFGILLHPETLRPAEPSREFSAASAGWKTTEREKLSGREKSAGEIPSRREENIAIVTVIELDFIGIIIVIISITIAIHLHSSTPFRCNI